MRVYSSDLAHSGSPPTQTNPSTKDTCVILYLEDNEDDCFLLAHSLRNAGVPCRIERLPSLEAVRTWIDSPPTPLPDLIIADLGLAGACGLDVLELIHKSPRLAAIPVILVTGYLPAPKRARAEQLGVKACVEKTHDWAELTEQVKLLLPR